LLPTPDRRTVGFLRSYVRPDLRPVYHVIDTDGHTVVQRSAERHAAWVRGDYDHLT
jgi:hypothetical protein